MLPTGEFTKLVLSERKVSGSTLRDSVFSTNPKVTTQTKGEVVKVPSTHTHSEALFGINLEGSCDEFSSGKIRKYEPLLVEYLPANYAHTLVFGRAPMRAFTIEIPALWLERAREYSLKLEDSIITGGLLRGLILRLYREFLISDVASVLAIEGLAYEMLAEVSRRNVKVVHRTRPRWLSQVIELLRARFHEPITLSEMAAAAGVHPVHLAREFRRFERCTVGEYIRRLRIERACNKLSSSNESIAAIAAGTGFYDQSHFGRIFKRVVGMTPIEYRANVSRC